MELQFIYLSFYVLWGYNKLTELICDKCGSFLPKVPKNFKHTVYCNICFNQVRQDESND